MQHMRSTRVLFGLALGLTLGAGGCGGDKRTDREPPVPGTNASQPRVVPAEDPETHKPLTGSGSGSSAAPITDGGTDAGLAPDALSGTVGGSAAGSER